MLPPPSNAAASSRPLRRPAPSRPDFLVPLPATGPPVSRSGLRSADRIADAHADRMLREADRRIEAAYARLVHAAAIKPTLARSPRSHYPKNPPTRRPPSAPTARTPIKIAPPPAQSRPNRPATSTVTTSNTAATTTKPYPTPPAVKRNATLASAPSSTRRTQPTFNPSTKSITSARRPGTSNQKESTVAHAQEKGGGNIDATRKRPETAFSRNQPIKTSPIRSPKSRNDNAGDGVADGRAAHAPFEITDDLLAQISALLASRIEPLFASAQLHFDSAVKRIETRSAALAVTEHVPPAATAAESSAAVVSLPQTNTDARVEYTGQHSDLYFGGFSAPAPIELVADEDITHASHSLAHDAAALAQGDATASKQPPKEPHHKTAVEPDPKKTTSMAVDSSHPVNPDRPQSAHTPIPEIHRTPYESAAHDNHDGLEIVIERLTEMEQMRRELLSSQHQLEPDVDNTTSFGAPLTQKKPQRDALTLPRSVADTIEAGRQRRLQYLSAYMGVASATPTDYGLPVQGPWDAIESIATEILDDILDKVAFEIVSFADDFVDGILSDEIYDGSTQPIKPDTDHLPI